MQKKTPKKHSHIPPKPRLTRAEIWVSVLSPAVVGNIVDWDLYIFLEKSSNFVAFPPGSPTRVESSLPQLRSSPFFRKFFVWPYFLTKHFWAEFWCPNSVHYRYKIEISALKPLLCLFELQKFLNWFDIP